MNVAAHIEALLRDRGIHPVLVDVGASGGAPDVWKPLARFSTYIGFDPDSREIKRDTESAFRAGIIINKALCADADAESVTFYLTESPYCSSMLPPDNDALSKYSFAQLFETKRQITVSATTLSKVVREQHLPHIDWLKIDTQGADLRIYLSLDEAMRRKLLAVDTEPGLIDAYRGEDLFIDVHKRMRTEGFWLSRLNIMGVPRISAATLKELGVPIENGLPQRTSGLRVSPGWCEARYLRAVESLEEAGVGEREFVLSWVFAVIDGQYGHALELAKAIRNALRDHALSDALGALSAQLMRTAAPNQQSAPMSFAKRALRKIRTLTRLFLDRGQP